MLEHVVVLLTRTKALYRRLPAASPLPGKLSWYGWHELCWISFCREDCV